MKKLFVLCISLLTISNAFGMQRFGAQELQAIASRTKFFGASFLTVDFVRQYNTSSRGSGLFKSSGALLEMSRQQALKVFDIEDGFSEDQLRKQYKKLAKQWHPDLHRDNQRQAENNFKEVQEAYAVLQKKEDCSAKSSYSQYSSAQHSYSAQANSQDDFSTYQQQKNMLKARGYSIVYQGSNGFCRVYIITDDKNGRKYMVYSKDTGLITRSYELYDEKGVCIKSFILPKASFVFIFLLHELDRYFKS